MSVKFAFPFRTRFGNRVLEKWCFPNLHIGIGRIQFTL